MIKPPLPDVRLPSVDSLLRHDELSRLLASFGHTALVDAIRTVLEAARAAGRIPDADALAASVADLLTTRMIPRLRPVFNLTGTLLHTNLGRAPLSEQAIAQATLAMRNACALEFDIETGARGERDSLIEGLLCELTGAEAATVVNNNAAAVLLVLAALAGRREVLVSRGELVEIGGAFRIPDVMRAAQVRLVEVGTTNRTHAHDFETAIGGKTAALMKVHASNYRVTGFTAEVSQSELSRIARENGLPLIEDLGAGSLVDLAQWGLPKEPVVRECLAAGVDVVTFSGDKLLGGPQAGLIVGRADLIAKIRKHPLKRALRVSKVTLAALEATLLTYRTPELLAKKLPSLRLMLRPLADLQDMGERLLPKLGAVLGQAWSVSLISSSAQAGSGSLPDQAIASLALAIAPSDKGRARGGALGALASRLRMLPMPVIGRIADGRILLDLRTLEDEAGFSDQLEHLR